MSGHEDVHQWALHDPYADGHPICIRFGDPYGANIAAGVWKAKKHKGAAAEARRAWKRLQAVKGDKLWMRHATVNDFYDGMARGRATSGKGGVSQCTRTVD